MTATCCSLLYKGKQWVENHAVLWLNDVQTPQRSWATATGEEELEVWQWWYYYYTYICSLLSVWLICICLNDYILTDVFMCTRALTLCCWIDLVAVNLCRVSPGHWISCYIYPCIALTLVLKPGTMMARNISVSLALPEPLQNRDTRATGGSYIQCSLRWARPLKGVSQSSSPLAGDWQQGSSDARRLDSSFIPGRELPSLIKCRGPGWQCLFQWWCFCHHQYSRRFSYSNYTYVTALIFHSAWSCSLISLLLTCTH